MLAQDANRLKLQAPLNKQQGYSSGILKILDIPASKLHVTPRFLEARQGCMSNMFLHLDTSKQKFLNFHELHH